VSVCTLKGVQDFKASRLQGFKASANTDFKDVHLFKASKLQGFKASRTQTSMTSTMVA